MYCRDMGPKSLLPGLLWPKAIHLEAALWSIRLDLFSTRMKEDGMYNIFEVSIALHGDKAKETEVVANTTMQEKNIIFPTEIPSY